jgi:hypothetical protein
MGWNLPLKLPGLIKALFDNVDTDLSANEILKLAYWSVNIDGSRIRMAKLTGGSQLIDGRSFVVIPEKTISAALKAFLTAPPVVSEDTPVSVPDEELAPATLTPVDLAGVSVTVENASGRVGQGALAATWLLRQGARIVSIKEASAPRTGEAVVTYPAGRADRAQRVAHALGITATRQASGSSIRVILGDTYRVAGERIPEAGASEVSGTSILHAGEWRALAATVDLPLVAPTYLPAAYTFSFRRDYALMDGDKNCPTVRVGYRYGTRDRYMGLSESTWLEAPIASKGIEVKGPGGIVYTVVGTSTKADHVWWVSDGVLHWVTNTLYSDVRPEELLAVALSALPVPGTSATASR